MSIELRTLEPKTVWKNFSNLNAVPRPSKKEELVIAFMINFGKSLNLETFSDAVGNVIIRKPATAGMEDRKCITLQSHLDMVHQKNSDTVFDFDTQGINMYIDGDWVRAKGTTLGADNGMGVAAIMALLESTDVIHPEIEALFTIDEETGMTGAQGLQAGYLKGEILLNLDTEEDDEIDIGCAGGIDVTAVRSYKQIKGTEKVPAFRFAIKGLQGGHSGMDIHKGLGNANKLINSFLKKVESLISIISIDGGGLRNAIPREGNALFFCKSDKVDLLRTAYKDYVKELKTEFEGTEPDLICSLDQVDGTFTYMDPQTQKGLILALDNAVNGVFKMSEEMPDLVEASNNIARVLVDNGKIKISCLTRSSVEESKDEVANSLKSAFENQEFTVTFSGAYPGWSPNRDSAILKVLTDIYEQMFKVKPAVVACHAGLECGILGTHYPEMDMISFGPTIKGAHSPDERASITSSMRFWKYLQEILKNIPVKNS